MRRFAPWLTALLITLVVLPVRADIRILDDNGRWLVFTQPARRIVSLAPHLTELLFAAGAGDRVVGVSAYSDYPEAAQKLPQIGGGAGLDLEGIVALRPDLIVAWASGNPASQIERLESLGLPVFVAELRRLDDIPRMIDRLGQLASTQRQAEAASQRFRARLVELRTHNAGPPQLRVFYQILDESLMTVNGQHMISDVIQLCGGENIFSALPMLTPRLDPEAVLKANPQVIVASGEESAWQEWRRRWRRWPGLSAVAGDRLYYLSPDLIHRPSPRLLEGATQMCAQFSQARRTLKP